MAQVTVGVVPVGATGILRAIWRVRYSVFLVFVLAFVSCFLIFAFIRPTFESSALLYIDADRSLRLDRSNRSSTEPQPGQAQDQVLYTQALIISSESVVRRAVEQFGEDRLFPAPDETNPSFLMRLMPPFMLKLGGNDRTYTKVWSSLSVRTEPKTNLIKVSYRGPDAAVSADFLKTLLDVYISRHAVLNSNPGVLEFLTQFKKSADNDLEVASAKLAAFGRSQELYSAEEQQRLELQRRAELETSVSATAAGIAEKEAQVKEISRQLQLMKLQDASPQVAALVRDTKRLRTDDPSAAPSTPTTFTASEPPLLLVRVYQDTLESLVRFNYELAGMREFLIHQRNELEKVNTRLTDVAINRAKYEKLRRDLEIARVSAEDAAKRSVDEQIELSVLKQRLVPTIQVVQEPTQSANPAFPTRSLVILSSLLSGLFAAAAWCGVFSLNRLQESMRLARAAE